MRIASASILIAVLCLAAEVRASPRLGSGESSLRHSRHHRLDDWSPRAMQELLRREGGEEGRGVDCCPTVEEVVQPKGGRNMDGLYVELYSGAGPNSPYNHSQRFYEFSCREDVLNKPCRFVERKLRNQSRCEQKYSYQYAIVRADDYEVGHGGGRAGLGPSHALFSNGTTGWKLDYISLRSGCSCVVTPKRAAGAGKRGKQGHSRERLGGAVPRLELDDPLDNT